MAFEPGGGVEASTRSRSELSNSFWDRGGRCSELSLVTSVKSSQWTGGVRSPYLKYAESIGLAVPGRRFGLALLIICDQLTRCMAWHACLEPKTKPNPKPSHRMLGCIAQWQSSGLQIHGSPVRIRLYPFFGWDACDRSTRPDSPPQGLRPIPTLRFHHTFIPG